MTIYKQSWTLILQYQPLSKNESITLSKEDHHYLLNVLRLREGDCVEISNGIGIKAVGKITCLNKKNASILLTEVMKVTESPIKVHLLIAQLKPSALEESVRLTSEIGVSSIHIFKADKTISKQTLKVEKLQKIANESLRISKSAYETSINNHNDLKNCIENIQNDYNEMCFIFCDEEAKIPLQDLKLNNKYKNIFIIIGPEGSFSQSERTAIQSLKNLFRISLGENILRAPTAAVCAVFYALHTI